MNHHEVARLAGWLACVCVHVCDSQLLSEAPYLGLGVGQLDAQVLLGGGQVEAHGVPGGRSPGRG